MKNILLITGCISPDKEAIFLKIRDSNLRLQQYIETIKWALEKTNFDIIIFCDNSDFNYDFKNIVTNSKKTFEYLSFKGDFNKSNKYGKGYGEGEIIKYAIDNSKYLKENTCFYKLTGRLTVKNINSILKKSQNNKNYFLNFLFSKNSIDTRFYKINKDDYMNYFYNAYEKVRDKDNYSLENVFFDIFKKNKIKYYCFSSFPIMRGISGSTGIKYNVKGIKLCIYQVLCFFKLYNMKLVSILVLKLVNKK